MAATPATFTRLPARPATAHATAAPTAISSGWSLPKAMVLTGFVAEVLAILVFTQGKLAELGQTGLVFIPAIVATLVLLRRASPRAFLAAGITLAILPLLVLFAFGAIAGLGNPLQGPSYVSLMLLLLGLLVGTPGGAMGFRAGKAGWSVPLNGSLGTRQGVFALVASTFLLAAAVMSALASSAAVQNSAAGGGYDLTPAATRALTAENVAFAPAQVAIPLGAVTELAVTNKDGMGHTFTYSVGGQTFSHDLLPGSTTKFLVKLDASGSIAYWCKPHSSAQADGTHSGMVGTLQVA